MTSAIEIKHIYPISSYLTFEWLRDGTRSHEMLTAIDHFEAQMWRNNEVAPPPDCSMELPQLKVALEAATRDVNRETVVQRLARI
jgi:hypothetical protein